MTWIICPVCRSQPCRCTTAPQWPVYYPPVSQPMGCICPPTSEQTCKSPMCPRKNHSQQETP
jgi:hypothetical protein